MELQIGSVVRSRAGRDKGHLLVVTAVGKDEYVQVANGKMRPLAAPKRKKKLHLDRIAVCDETLAADLGTRTLTDSRLREVLRGYASEL